MNQQDGSGFTMLGYMGTPLVLFSTGNKCRGVFRSRVFVTRRSCGREGLHAESTGDVGKSTRGKSTVDSVPRGLGDHVDKIGPLQHELGRSGAEVISGVRFWWFRSPHGYSLWRSAGNGSPVPQVLSLYRRQAVLLSFWSQQLQDESRWRSLTRGADRQVGLVPSQLLHLSFLLLWFFDVLSS